MITDVVITETIWVLTGKRYQLPKDIIVDVIHALFAEKNIQFEDTQSVWCALKGYVNAPSIKVEGKTKQAAFSDALLINKAKRYSQINKIKVDPIYRIQSRKPSDL